MMKPSMSGLTKLMMQRVGVVSELVPDQAVKPWYVYLVRAANGSLYCGISDDPQRRFAAHQKGQGARYFKTSPAQALVYVEQWPDKGEALRQERLVKRLRKSAKEALVASYGAVAAAN
ncbi:GIY-YIG catalytic domain protein [compost metagenome]